jgi:transposase
MNLLLPQWEMLDEQLEAVEAKIAERAVADEQAKLLESMPGLGHYSAVAISATSSVSNGPTAWQITLA